MYYHLDLRAILGPGRKTTYGPDRLLNLIEGLPEGSHFKAAVYGGVEYREWNMQLYLLANLFDAICTNTAATGMFKKPPKFPPHYRPGQKPDKAKKKQQKQAVTLESLHEGFAGMMASGNFYAL